MAQSADPLRPQVPQTKPVLNEDEALRDHQQICTKLSEIFVHQMGVANRITLDVNPSTGMKEFRFELNRNSPILTQLNAQDIKGIPVRFVLKD